MINIYKDVAEEFIKGAEENKSKISVWLDKALDWIVEKGVYVLLTLLFIYIGDEEYSTSSIVGLKEWFMQANKYEPYTDIAQFTTEGIEEWINQGYEFAKQLRSIIPKDIKLYYGYWHQFGDGKWRCREVYI